MDKSEIINRISKIENIHEYPKGSSAVIIPLLEVDGDMHIIFEERAHTLKFQPGDICFPGGHIEDGETPKEAAIREFKEELHCDNIEVICGLTPLMGPTAAPVYPFVALVNNRRFSYSEDEVARIFTVPVTYLLEHPPVSYPMERKTVAPENFPYEKVTGGKSTYNWHNQHYDMWVYEDTDPVIWGFTGRLLHSFLEFL